MSGQIPLSEVRAEYDGPPEDWPTFRAIIYAMDDTLQKWRRDNPPKKPGAASPKRDDY
jgi:hypothetical protein